MIASETTGYLCGIEYDSSVGLTLRAEWHGQDPYSEPSRVVFPWNRNLPQKMDLSNLRRKKIKITVEIIEDEKAI